MGPRVWPNVAEASNMTKGHVARAHATAVPRLSRTLARGPDVYRRRTAPKSCAELYGEAGGLKIRRRLQICPTMQRSEEHTSELQSVRHLVCRLLLEKK